MFDCGPEDGDCGRQRMAALPVSDAPTLTSLVLHFLLHVDYVYFCLHSFPPLPPAHRCRPTSGLSPGHAPPSPLAVHVPYRQRTWSRRPHTPASLAREPDPLIIHHTPTYLARPAANMSFSKKVAAAVIVLDELGVFKKKRKKRASRARLASQTRRTSRRAVTSYWRGLTAPTPLLGELCTFPLPDKRPTSFPQSVTSQPALSEPCRRSCICIAYTTPCSRCK
ncbi:hypothetical protein J6590_103173 [Homalodisca vitripennis]|nr:hypothetical protein J6590_103173 [Homalodisca vitripennis]